MSANELKTRDQIPSQDKWDLTQIYKDDSQWEADLKKIPQLADNLAAFRGKLSESADTLFQALQADEALDRCLEDVYHYASLLTSQDQGDSDAQEKENLVMMEWTNASEKTSFYQPEIIAIDDSKIDQWLKEDRFQPYRIYIQKMRHIKAHVLSEKEERILALQGEAANTADNAFSLLTDVDMTFGSATMEDGSQKEITHSTWSEMLHNQNRSIRQEAYEKFYGAYESHANTLAALYTGSVQQDIFTARARGYGSALEAALFKDKVPVSVYTNLIETVHKNLPTLHRYYALRKKVLGVSELRHWDVYVPLVKTVKSKTSFDQAVEIVRNALAPLGKEYTDTLCGGLKGGWTDKYENKGKRSGAFSSGCYRGYPYILLNYNDSSIRDLFTVAHEGGHSMHSYYSVRNNPFMSYEYTIFEAEVASTFNEELVFQYLLKNAQNDEMKKYLLSMRADDILATLHRQTMFAEFELKCHQMVEQHIPLSTEVLRKTYRELLELYFGPDMVFEKSSDLEGLRIPHFYNAFYVYKYATGISAALALAKRVTSGGEQEKEDYFKFLKSGGSRYPIESLRVAGVDMEKTESVQAALDTFKDLVEKLEKSL